ncbi:smoothelin-like protein 1 [Orycteropus afer afer]|uniref:Smoothelin-like protein 1 n=1 Tax=Orycteropus afer afer TaxID=1230840 RepID=A0A8B7AVQ7_ORYAF|nr:smoothelin-like protein 1 [Orycteropus afer afer]
MEQKEGKPLEDETTVSPTTENPGALGNRASTETEANGAAGESGEDRPPDGVGKPENAPAKDSIPAELQGEADGLDEVQVKSKGEAEPEPKMEDGGKQETTEAPLNKTDRKGETKSELKEAEGKEEATLAEEKQKAEEEAKPESREKADGDDQARAEPKEADGKEAAMMTPQGESDKREEAKDEPKEQAGAKEANTEAQKAASEAKPEHQELDGKKEADSDAKEEVSEAEEEEEAPQRRSSHEHGGANEEQDQHVEIEPEEGERVVPSSPEEWPESPTEEGHGLSPDEVGPEIEASGETSPSASESSPSDVPQSPTEAPSPGEKKKEKAPERRVSAPTRPRGARAQNRKAIVDKFGGAASGPTALFRNTKAAGAAIGGVKNMLLEWCRAMTRKYEHVDIQNFSSSWSSGMAFCALIHKFFPDAFDYSELDPTQRRHNFTLAFSTAEKLADCAQLLEVDDMVRLAVPDSKCVYTYIQELYRSLVQKGLVKTKKK